MSQRLEKASSILKWAIENNSSLGTATKHFGVGSHYLRDTKKESSGKPGYADFIRLYDEFHASQERHLALAKECKDNGIPLSDVNHYWWKGENFSIHVKNDLPSYPEMRDDLVAEMKKYAPKYPIIKRSKIKDAHLLVIDPADIHLGKLADSFETGEDYNNEIAIKRVHEGVDGIINKTSNYNFDRVLLIIGNDILHTDTPKRTTTSGTAQDTDGMWYSNFLKAKHVYIDVIEKLMTIADVHVILNISNHDYMSGFFLADTIYSWFAKSKNVTFNVDMKHRKYFTYHSNLIGTTHGDGAKTSDLPLLMAQEASKDWASCPHRYFYTHHIHHKDSKDYGTVCVESLRSPSGTDGWHHRNGYQHAPKAIEAFVHHPIQGQVARITHLF